MAVGLLLMGSGGKHSVAAVPVGPRCYPRSACQAPALVKTCRPAGGQHDSKNDNSGDCFSSGGADRENKRAVSSALSLDGEGCGGKRQHAERNQQRTECRCGWSRDDRKRLRPGLDYRRGSIHRWKHAASGRLSRRGSPRSAAHRRSRRSAGHCGQGRPRVDLLRRGSACGRDCCRRARKHRTGDHKADKRFER